MVAMAMGGVVLMAQGPAATAPRQRFLVDGIFATVNDSAIMMSAVKDLAAGRIRAETAKGQPLTQQRLELIYRQELDREIDRHRMAQAAKSLGTWTPQQVDEIVKSELLRDQQEQVRDLGSINAFSRELKRQGRDWPTWEGEQRIDKLNELFDELAVRQRLARRQNLFLTPRMLREAWNNPQVQSRFQREAQAWVTQVQFAGPQAPAQAAAAAELWRQQDLTARQLADQYPGARVVPPVSAREMAADLAKVAEFALTGPAGAVSPPLPIGQQIAVAKVTEFRPGRNAKFEDEAVQAELRGICLRAVFEEFQLQALERARQRTEVWEPQVTRR